MSLRPQGTPLAQILEALSDTDWRVRREAISLASQTRDKDPLIDALLVRVVDTGNIGLRNAAIEVLGIIGQGSASKFAQACTEASASGRKFLIEAMGKTRDPQMIENLEGLIRGSDTNAAAAAVEVIRPPNDLPPANTGRPSARRAVSSTARRTVSSRIGRGSGRRRPFSRYGKW